MHLRRIHLKQFKQFTFGLSIFLLIATYVLLSSTHNFILSILELESYFKFLPTKPCSCATCISEHVPSPWYDERFKDTIPLLLTKENNELPKEVYSWWLALQREKKPASFEVTVKTLFETISGDSDFLVGSTSRCRRCAVVGNSGNLKNSGYGKWIDGHDMIMRMNNGPIVGYEADVGGRTTHQFIYPESAWKIQENATLVLIPFKTLDLLWIISALTTGTRHEFKYRVPRKIKARRDKILVYNPIFMKHIFDIWLEKHGLYPSTGILCIIFSLHVCDQVAVYGFGVDRSGNWHHYWDNITATIRSFRIETDVHDWFFQTNLTEALHSLNKITIFR